MLSRAPADPGFVLDLWPLTLTGLAWDVEQIRARRIVDVFGIQGWVMLAVYLVVLAVKIAELRKDIQSHVLRLPVSYFDSNKSGVLISRIMNDPEGIRNLVGTGIIQLIGGVLTVVVVIGVAVGRGRVTRRR